MQELKRAFNFRNEWCKLWDRVRGGAPLREAAFGTLWAHYTEPWRMYHGSNHLWAVLEEFEPVRNICSNPNAVEMALWWHDAVYEPTAKNNEERSVELFRSVTRIALERDFIDLVTPLILATKHAAPANDDAGWIC